MGGFDLGFQVKVPESDWDGRGKGVRARERENKRTRERDGEGAEFFERCSGSGLLDNLI